MTSNAGPAAGAWDDFDVSSLCFRPRCHARGTSHEPHATNQLGSLTPTSGLSGRIFRDRLSRYFEGSVKSYKQQLAPGWVSRLKRRRPISLPSEFTIGFDRHLLNHGHRVESGFRLMRQNNDISMYRQTRRSCERIGVPMRPYQYVPPPPPPTFGGVSAHASSSSINTPSGGA